MPICENTVKSLIPNYKYRGGNETVNANNILFIVEDVSYAYENKTNTKLTADEFCKLHDLVAALYDENKIDNCIQQHKYQDRYERMLVRTKLSMHRVEAYWNKKQKENELLSERINAIKKENELLRERNRLMQENTISMQLENEPTRQNELPVQQETELQQFSSQTNSQTSAQTIERAGSIENDMEAMTL